MITITQEEIDLVIIHLVYFSIVTFTLILPLPISLGLKLTLLVLLYIFLISLVAFKRQYEQWFDILTFAIILSVLQIFPDWFLASKLSALIFPDHEFINVGPVPLVMAGLWTLPLFMLIILGVYFSKNFSAQTAYVGVGLFSLIVFGVSEQVLTFIWYAADNLTKIGNVAVYILIPEILLGLTTYYGYTHLQKHNNSLSHKALIALFIMIFYIGSASFFHMTIEVILVPWLFS